MSIISNRVMRFNIVDTVSHHLLPVDPYRAYVRKSDGTIEPYHRSILSVPDARDAFAQDDGSERRDWLAEIRGYWTDRQGNYRWKILHRIYAGLGGFPHGHMDEFSRFAQAELIDMNERLKIQAQRYPALLSLLLSKEEALQKHRFYQDLAVIDEGELF